MKPENKSSKLQEESGTPSGTSDPVLEELKRLGGPITRERYLQLAYFGEPPEQLTAEQEAELPPELQIHPSEDQEPENKGHGKLADFD